MPTDYGYDLLLLVILNSVAAIIFAFSFVGPRTTLDWRAPDGFSAIMVEAEMKAAMVGDGVNEASALAQTDLGVAIGAGTDVAIETADVVLMRSEPLDMPIALRIGKGTLRKMRRNLGWAVGYNAIALPIAAGVFAFSGFTLRPEIAALSMSGSSCWSL